MASRDGWPFFLCIALLYGVDHVEDRQVHGDDHTSDDDAEENDHDRLKQREQVADRRVDFFIVEVGNLGQHFVQTTGLLTDRDHRDNHRREDFGLLKRLGDGITARDRRARLHDRVLNDAVAGSLRGDLESFENADAGADQRSQRTGEARHRGLTKHVAEDGHLQHQPVDDELAVRRRVVLPEEVRTDDDYRTDCPPVTLEEAGGADDDSGRQRKGESDRREHVLEHRNDENEQHHDGDRRDAHDDRGIDHRALNLSYKGVVLFEERRQSHKNGVENTTGFAGGHHVHVKVGERARVLGKRVGNRVARLYVEDHLLGDFRQSLVVCLVRKNGQGLYQRQTRVDHRRELTGEDDDVACLDGATADFLRGVLVDLDDAEPLLSELCNNVIARGGVDRRRAKISV